MQRGLVVADVDVEDAGGAGGGVGAPGIWGAAPGVLVERRPVAVPPVGCNVL